VRDEVRGIAERWYRAFLAADAAELDAVLDPGAAWVIPLDTELSGVHRGARGHSSLRERIAQLTGGTWRPLRDDSFDVAVSPWHAVVMDRYLAQRGERRLDSNEAVILAIEEERIVRLFHYLHGPVGFASFWSPQRGPEATA
jgi:ketosteroid isomerase-like protein